jgi:hypothetical protein
MAERRDNFEAPAAMTPSAGKLDRRFVGLSAGIAEEHAPVAKQAAQPRGQPGHWLGMEYVRNVGELFGLLADRAHHSRRSRQLSALGTKVACRVRFANGRCVERWSQADFLGLMQQLQA